MKIRQSQIKILSLSETVYKWTLSNWHILWATNATASEQKSDNHKGNEEKAVVLGLERDIWM